MPPVVPPVEYSSQNVRPDDADPGEDDGNQPCVYEGYVDVEQGEDEYLPYDGNTDTNDAVQYALH